MSNTCLSALEERIKKDIETLATFNSTPGEGVTRVALSDEAMCAREYIKEQMEKLSLEIREDAAGNIFGIYPGRNRTLAPVWTGSHLDTVLNGGAFDGMAGVVCGLEAIRILKEAEIVPKRDLCVIVYTSEEPTRYGMGCIGSRALAGRLTEESAKMLFDDNGVSLYETLSYRGFDTASFSQVKKERGDVYASVELHIEQAEVLETEGKMIGVVHTISAPTEMHITISGKQSHAGATPMEIRTDPMTAVAEVILALEKMARSYSNPSTVATVGKVDVNPNASNVIPAQVSFSVDIRSSSFEEKEEIQISLLKILDKLQSERNVEIETKVVCNDRPAVADKKIVEKIISACEQTGYSYMTMASGAYHDSMLVSEFAPYSMIFVPSKDGISHDRKEWTDYNVLASGTNVLAKVLLELADEE